jgi:peptidyl-prolyl cis-trans isomerase C
MMSTKSRVLLLSAASILFLSACQPEKDKKSTVIQMDNVQASKSETITNVAATVNGTPISMERVDMLLKQRTAMGQPENPEMRKSIIDQLSIQLLASQEAVKKGLDKTAEVKDQIDLTRESILAKAFVQDFIKTHPLTDDKLKAEYDKIKTQMTGSEYKARHILVKSEDEARSIIAKLKKNPASFEALAKAESNDPGSKNKGGDLGWFSTNGMVPEFSNAVTKLSKGKFTEEPVKSQFGYHIIMLDDIRPMQVPTFDQIKPQIAQKMQQDQLKGLIDEMKAKAKIEIKAVAPAAPAAASAAPALTK